MTDDKHRDYGSKYIDPNKLPPQPSEKHPVTETEHPLADVPLITDRDPSPAPYPDDIINDIIKKSGL